MPLDVCSAPARQTDAIIMAHCAPMSAAATPPRHSPDALRAWLRLSLQPGLNIADTLALLAALGQPETIYRTSVSTLARHIPTTLARHMAQPPDATLATAIDAAQRWADIPGHHVLTLADNDYPAALLNIADPPPLLYVRGNPQALSRPGIAIVGARNATTGGLANARAFGRYLASAGWCIVSGLARGIDAAAHLGALDAETHGSDALVDSRNGGTVAVFGTGIDRVYPSAHQALAERIIAHGGALITEFPLGMPPLPHHFPRRNRLVAGLAHGVLVVEAARQSGSLSTARLANESGREVFAIPGSIHSPLSRGCHALIRQGAKLVETAQDIVDELGELPRAAPVGTPDAPTDPTSETAPLLAALGYDPVLRDDLQRRTGLDDAALQSRLLELELDGLVERLPGERYQRIR